MQHLYEFLDSYGLRKRGHIKRQLDTFSESKLAELVNSYLTLARGRPLVCRAEAGATDIYPDSWMAPIPMKLIGQLGIYANRIYLHDPLADMALQWDYLEGIPYILKGKTREERVSNYRFALAHEIERMLALKPLAECGILHFSPTALIQLEKQPGELYAADLFGPKGSLLDIKGESPELPPDFAKYCSDHMAVFPATVVDGDSVVLESESLTPRRMIAVQFRGDPTPRFYTLWRTLPVTDPDDRGKGILHMYWDIQGDPSAVDPSTFHHWVRGVKLETAIMRIKHLNKDLALAASARARFITSLPVSRDLAQLGLGAETTDPDADVVTALLHLNLPFFDNASFSRIAKARRNEVAFEEFRVALDKAFREVNKLSVSLSSQKVLDEVCRDLLSLPCAKIQQQMSIMKRNLFIDAVVLVGSLASVFVIRGNTLVTATAVWAATEAAKWVKQEIAERDKVRQLPGYFYWDVTRQT